VSVQSLMELVQGARDKDDLRIIKRFLAELGFTGSSAHREHRHRSLVYVEEYGLSAGLRAGDAITAATAVENALPLMSATPSTSAPSRNWIWSSFDPERGSPFRLSLVVRATQRS